MPFIQALFAAAAGNSFAGGGAWNISTATPTGAVLNMSAQSSSMRDIAISSDGTKLYAISSSFSGVRYTYTLATPWDINTAAFSSSSALPNTNSPIYTSSGYACTFYESSGVQRFAYSVLNYEGSTLRAAQRVQYFIGATLYSTSSGSTILYTSMSGNLSGNRTATVTSGSTNVVFYSMPTGNYSSLNSRGSLSVSTQTSGASPGALFVRDDGLKTYIGSAQTLYQYEMATEWTASGGTYVESFDCSTEIGSETIQGLSLSSDGTRMYVFTNADKVYEYTLG